MSEKEYIKFLRRGFSGERLAGLKSDGLRWRWWKLYCLSDQKVFPGLVSKNLSPLPEMSLVSELYQSSEFKEVEKPLVWKEDKKLLVDSGLVRSANVNSHEYLWNVDFHSFQDRFSKKGAQLKDKFYVSFMGLNERDKAIFIVLLSEFKPKDIELEAFGIPQLMGPVEAYANKRLPLFDGVKNELPSIKSVLDKITESVAQFQVERRKMQSGEVKGFVEWYCAEFKKKTNSSYSVGGKDFKLVAEMLKIFSISELQKLASRFFREEDKWVKKAGFTVGVFKTMLNRLVSTSERRPLGLDDYAKYRKT